MKKWLPIVIILIIGMLPLAAQNGAGGGGNGNGGNGQGGNGNGGGNGMYGYNILAGTPFSFSGTVIDVPMLGDGILVSTGSGTITVYGLGSYTYWESLNIGRPVVGDSVSGQGYAVDYSGVLKNILTEITINGSLVPLRDENGYPLWRHINGNGGSNTWAGGGYGNYAMILNGLPFEISGIVVGTAGDGMVGNGLELATEAGSFIVRGLGPISYWNSLELEKPVEGDQVTVIGYTVEIDGQAVNILMAVLVNGVRIDLRDPETAVPMWRK